MKVYNKTRRLVLSEDACRADSFFERFKGLMFSGPSDMVLVSPRESIRESSIHMFFMRYPIDVLWVDGRGRVVDALEKVAPSSLFKPWTWRIYRPVKPAKYVIELGKGDLSETKNSDEIRFIQ